MAEADLPAAFELSRAVGWPHRLEDWQFVFSLGQGLSAYSGDRLVGTAMWWTYAGAQTRIGMVIVDPTIQRSGIGRTLMETITAEMTTPSLVLNATTAGETLYRQMGFQPVGTIVQHQGAAFEVPLVQLGPNRRIRPMGRNDRDRLVDLDARALGFRRDDVVDALIAQGDAVLLDDGNQTTGFAFFRRFGRGFAIGPVVAQDTQSAKALIAHWISSNAGMFLRIDVPGEAGLSNWLIELGLVPASPVISMVRGAPLPGRSDMFAFAIANQALG
jgi:GNAT superfamily N-acetyltransferase